VCDAYREATLNPDCYLILDFAQDTDDLIRYRTNDFPSERPPIICALGKDEADKIELSPSTITKEGETTITKSSLKTAATIQ
jgi:hypothetical protein